MREVKGQWVDRHFALSNQAYQKASFWRRIELWFELALIALSESGTLSLDCTVPWTRAPSHALSRKHWHVCLCVLMYSFDTGTWLCGGQSAEFASLKIAEMRREACSLMGWRSLSSCSRHHRAFHLRHLYDNLNHLGLVDCRLSSNWLHFHFATSCLCVDHHTDLYLHDLS